MIGGLDQAIVQEHLMGPNETFMQSQVADVCGCLIPLVARRRVIREVRFVVDRWSGPTYPRGRCRRLG